MPEEVEVKVKQTNEGTALRDAIRDAEKLKQVQQGPVNPQSDVGRIFARQDAARAAKAERIPIALSGGDNAMAVEMRRQSAEAKLREARGTRFARLGSNLALQAADGGLSPGSVLSLAASGPGLLAATAAVLGLKLLNQSIAEIDKTARSTAQSIGLANRTRAAASTPGAEGADATVSNLAAIERQLEDAKAKRGTFADQGVSDQVTLWMRGISGGRLGGDTSGEKLGIENEEEIDRLEMAGRVAAKRAKDRFGDSDAAAGLEIQRAMLAGDKAQAQAIQDKIAWQKEYSRLIGKQAAEWQAQEGAGNKVALEQMERSRGRGAIPGLINARSGQADIARGAELARGDYSTGRAVESMHSTMRRMHGDSLKPRLGSLLTPQLGPQLSPRMGRL